MQKTWKEHINDKIVENLKRAIKHRDEEKLEIDDMASIDSIEDSIVRCEILSGDMIEIPKDKFVYDIEEGDIINLKLTYKNGVLVGIDVLDKNQEEKRLRLKMMREKMKTIQDKKG